jgi:hypothetical protein
MDGLTGNKSAEFLTIPTELRLGIYRLIFQHVKVTLLCDAGAAAGQEDNDGDLVPESGHGHRHSFSINTWATTTASRTKPNHDASIFLVCRKTYNEARSVFFQTATFQLQSLSEEHRLSITPTTTRTTTTTTTTSHLSETQSPPTFPPSPTTTNLQISQIQHLSLPHTLLRHYSPSELHRLFPQLSSLNIRQIAIPLAHQTLSSLTPHLYTLHQETALSRGDSPKHDIEHSPGLRLFQTLLCAMEDERQMEGIMAHFAACHGRYALELQFLLRCRHVGLLVVPGMFPMANAPHRHAERDVTYTFNAGGGR